MEVEKKRRRKDLIQFHNMTIFVPTMALTPKQRGHEFYKLSGGFYKHHKHA